MTEQCVRCNGTGEVDSGALDPQGHFIQILCECQTEQHECEFTPMFAECLCGRGLTIGELCKRANADILPRKVSGYILEGK